VLMQESCAQTASLCPHCLRRIAARRIVENDAVYLEKKCPEHGALDKVLLWRNYPKSFNSWDRNRERADGALQKEGSSSFPAAADHDGCPFECGICSNHRQKTCSAILEVTHACNLQCPICFSASAKGAGADPDLRSIEQMLCTIRDSAGVCPLQLSGGEPAQRNDLPQIVELARRIGFDHIQINTNGIRLAQDADFARALQDAGVTDFFLQFDGVTNDVYRRIRGAALLPFKLQAIERCADLKIGVILVPTLVRNVNDDQIGAIIQLAKKWMPAVKGVHYQPMTYLGRYPDAPVNADRILLPEILAAIEHQTGGELKAENFIPAG
jgi:7,8-dihydro-6-hydroxymethylpterin dimethyltransferase